MIARGEFSIVIAGLGVSAGLDSDLALLAAAYALCLALAGPVLTKHYTVLLPIVDALDRMLTLRSFRGAARVLDRPARTPAS